LKGLNIIMFGSLLILFLNGFAHSELVSVPDIADSNLTADQADEILDRAGLAASFTSCFSTNVNEGYMLSNGQHPISGMQVEKGSIVRANKSLGNYPIFLNSTESEAKKILDKLSVPFVFIPGRKECLEDNVIYDQMPLNCSCIIEGETIKIYVNKKLNIIILTPSSNQIVSRVVTIEGAVEPSTLKGEKLWILVGPIKTPDDWWPQAGGPLKVIDSRFSGPAFLGGAKGDDFQIAVLVANESINEKIIQWRENCNVSNYWPPITKDDPISKVMIPKETIDGQIAKSLIVKLGE
jgi:hypothetical protein